MLWKGFLRNMQERISTNSIRAAVREQKLLPIYRQLTRLVPDITHQYTTFELDSEYLKTKVRAQHSFQIALVSEALQLINKPRRDTITIVDIGDSSGTHLQYIKGLHQDHNIHALSIDIDSESVKRIKEKGLQAICARAEDLPSLSIEADIFLSFQMLEHLINPTGFLRSLSETNCQTFVVTVPYLARSRVALYHIRKNRKQKLSSDEVHIFELSPEDWRLLFQHSGWAILADRIYLQYPRRSPFRFLLRSYWKWHDFEGFYGAILKPDKSWSSLWQWW